MGLKIIFFESIHIKVKNFKFRRYRFLNAYINMEKIIKFGRYWNSQIFHHHKESISIKNVDNGKIVVSNKVSSRKKVSSHKKGFQYFIGYKDVKKIDLCVYFLQKWVQTEKTLIKLNIIRKVYWNFGKS